MILEKESIFNNDNYNDNDANSTLLEQWKDNICKCGFELLRYRLLLTKDSRKAHAFAFKAIDTTTTTTTTTTATATTDANALSTNGLWISQDFIIDKNDNNSTNDKVVVGDEPLTPPIVKAPSSAPVAIIGGGLAGSAIARSLYQRGIPVTVYEKDASFSARKQGYALTMQQGAAALKRLGLETMLNDVGVSSIAHISFDADGNVLGAYGAGIRKDDNDDLKLDKRRGNIHIPRQKLRYHYLIVVSLLSLPLPLSLSIPLSL